MPAPDRSLPVIDNTSPALRRCWHAVALTEEVTDEPTQVWLLGEPWVLVRLDDRVTALEDRCPHRLAALSAGRVNDGVLQCGYHGWTFDGDGRCRSIPPIGDAGHIPPRANATPAWGVQERYGLVWIAPEEPLAGIHEMPEWDDPRFDTAASTVVRTPVSAAQLVDNFLDASHFPYVHEATFGTEEAAEVVEEGVTRDGWVVRTTFDTWYRNFDDPLVATGEHEAVQPQRLLKQGSASTSVLLRLGFPVTGATFTILFCCQPETATSTRVYKLLARDDLGGDVARLAATVKDEDTITAEDLAVLERYRRMELHLDLRVEVHTRADRLSVAWRRLLADMVALDDTSSGGAAEVAVDLL